VVGCEPGAAADVEEMAAGLSPPVRAAVGDAVVLVEELVGRLLAEGEVVPTTEGKPCRY
jgi:hypothetical protein